MNVRRSGDAGAFLEAASPLLLADEARHNLIFGIAGTLRDHPSHYPEYALWLAEDGPEIVGAALRTPPHNLVLARPRGDSAIEALAAAIDDELPGIIAAQPYSERTIVFGSRPIAAHCSSRTAFRSRISSTVPNEFHVSAYWATMRSMRARSF